MATALDVAKYILSKRGPMTAMKLQKLVYYSHAWHLVWDEKRLFDNPIQAWANGPVAPDLYREHRGLFQVKPEDISGDSEALVDNERATVDGILEFYGDRPASELSQLTHLEAPWNQARGDIAPDARSSQVITDAMMAEYYGSLL